jgi:hypothetical protein
MKTPTSNLERPLYSGVSNSSVDVRVITTAVWIVKDKDLGDVLYLYDLRWCGCNVRVGIKQESDPEKRKWSKLPGLLINFRCRCELVTAVSCFAVDRNRNFSMASIHDIQSKATGRILPGIAFFYCRDTGTIDKVGEAFKEALTKASRFQRAWEEERRTGSPAMSPHPIILPPLFSHRKTLMARFRHAPDVYASCSSYRVMEAVHRTVLRRFIASMVVVKIARNPAFKPRLEGSGNMHYELT